MHNRARMIIASFLTRDLGIDWRHGLAHFDDLLADADVANNAGNWQWVAGTGNDTRPNRVINPLRQAERFDRTASTSAATCRSWSRCRARRSTAPGCSTASAASTTPSRSSTTTRRRPPSRPTAAHRIARWDGSPSSSAATRSGPAARRSPRRRPSTGRRSSSATAPPAAPTSSPTRSTTPPTCGRWSSRAATGCWRSARSARSRPSSAVGSLRLPGRLHRPPPRPLDLRRRARATRRRASTPAGAREVISAWGAGGQAPRDGGVYWQTIGPALRDPGRDPADRRPRRRGRDDDRLRVRRRRRARPRLRGALRRRQPRQRARRRARSASPSWRPTASPTPTRLRDGLAAVLPRLGAVGR